MKLRSNLKPGLVGVVFLAQGFCASNAFESEMVAEADKAAFDATVCINENVGRKVLHFEARSDFAVGVEKHWEVEFKSGDRGHCAQAHGINRGETCVLMVMVSVFVGVGGGGMLMLIGAGRRSRGADAEDDEVAAAEALQGVQGGRVIEAGGSAGTPEGD